MSRAPRYQVIYDDLVSQIRAGALSKDSRLPGETELAKQYGVSRMTVRQALDLLESERFVIRRQGSGTFVSDHAEHGRRLNRLRSFADEIADTGGTASSRVVRCETAPASAEVAEAFGIAEGDLANRLTRVRLIGGVPAALQDAWVPYSAAPSLSREPLVDDSLYRTLTKRFGVELRYADQSMVAVLLDAEQADLLGTLPGRPALEIHRTTYGSRGEVVEFTTSWTLPEFPFLMRIDAE
ncbi:MULTISPECIES: GntR family transcriptional regulator [Streptomyces]|uniref:GntR family transcriptional regulator n=1 Tax=Streptomyces TaxID=1883 RepID=UPI00081DB95C|nr:MULTISPECIES: GntR family transcriptional regulator [unclassified Streptomyces]AUA08625.1 HTH-type transcriptional repressor YvoA [Streptomyces sp. M56]MCC4315330.1 GntR family transcriptional regulator [Streptomyces malaysiensis]MCM3808378.1 GntR family transcriptional regulator [Streptomyces sp. DR7-3]SCF84795.1 GntR family transcriptional regulator [Streptomyces sp. MnatMP-M27]